MVGHGEAVVVRPLAICPSAGSRLGAESFESPLGFRSGAESRRLISAQTIFPCSPSSPRRAESACPV
jgi:hypothetical protein